MDLSTLKPTEREIEIVHPVTREPFDIKITLMSVTDERLAKLKRKFQDERLRLETKGKGFKAEDIDDNLKMLAFSSIIDWKWEGEANFHGEKPALNRNNAFRIFTELPWFLTQIQEAIGDEDAFFRT